MIEVNGIARGSVGFLPTLYPTFDVLIALGTLNCYVRTVLFVLQNNHTISRKGGRKETREDKGQ